MKIRLQSIAHFKAVSLGVHYVYDAYSPIECNMRTISIDLFCWRLSIRWLSPQAKAYRALMRARGVIFEPAR